VLETHSEIKHAHDAAILAKLLEANCAILDSYLRSCYAHLSFNY
jgi:hypothetical protein